jgi:DNA-binding CsgD family transcriptional regulator
MKLSGARKISAKSVQESVRFLMNKPSGTNVRLTFQQSRMIAGLAEGLSMKELAAKYEISIHTVHSYLKGAYRHLNANGGNHAVALAIRAGLI